MTKDEGSVANEFDELYARYANVLRNRAKNLCQGSKILDPMDLVQEAFLRFIAYLKTPGVDREVPPARRLLAIMTRYFVDQNRRQQSRKRAEGDPALPGRSLGQPSDPDRYEGISPAQFGKAVQALPKKQRLAYLLWAEGKSYEEIARMLGGQVGTLRKRVFDARRNLREQLAPYLEDEGRH